MALSQSSKSRTIDVIVLGVGLSFLYLTYKEYRRFAAPTAATIDRPLSKLEAQFQAESALNHLKDNPEDFNAWSQLAVAYFSEGVEFFPKGLSAIDKARTYGAVNSALFYYAGVMYDHLGLTDYGIHELEKFIRHFPDHRETLIRLGNLYLRQKDFDRAQGYYEKALSHHPKDPAVVFNLGIVYKERGQLEQALNALKDAESSLGRLPEGGEYQKGEILRLKGNEDLAIQSYKAEIEKFPQSLPALQALESLAKKRKQWAEASEYKKMIQEVRRSSSTATLP